MAVRDAKFADVPRLAELKEEAKQRSIYANCSVMDPDEVKQFFTKAIQRHGHTNNGGTLVLVAEKEGVVEGYIVGLLDSVYPCIKEMWATDLEFYVSDRADALDASKMLRRIEAWAEPNPRVIEVHLGVTDAIGDWKRTSKLYERLGYEPCGAMFKKRIER